MRMQNMDINLPPWRFSQDQEQHVMQENKFHHQTPKLHQNPDIQKMVVSLLLLLLVKRWNRTTDGSSEFKSKSTNTKFLRRTRSTLDEEYCWVCHSDQWCKSSSSFLLLCLKLKMILSNHWWERFFDRKANLFGKMHRTRGPNEFCKLIYNRLNYHQSSPQSSSFDYQWFMKGELSIHTTKFFLLIKPHVHQNNVWSKYNHILGYIREN